MQDQSRQEWRRSTSKFSSQRSSISSTRIYLLLRWQTAQLTTSLRSTSKSRSSPRLCQNRGLTAIRRIHYSDRYSDDNYEYRHVILPKPLLKLIPKELFDEKEGTLRLLSEAEWRGIGITQSLGWQHYEVHGLTCVLSRVKYSHFGLQLPSPMSSFSAALKTMCHPRNPSRLLPRLTQERSDTTTFSRS